MKVVARLATAGHLRTSGSVGWLGWGIPHGPELHSIAALVARASVFNLPWYTPFF